MNGDAKAPRGGRGKSARNLKLIAAAYRILEEIQPATVRAACYRLFTLQLIASMAKGETNKVSTQLTWARERGVIPWSWIVDETREAERISAWKDPAAYVEAVKRSYRRDRWADQPKWIEVWSEKGTIRGTLAPVLDKYGVTFRVMHGYTSATTVNQVAEETCARQQQLTVFYVGDWDPSGLHMSAVDLPGRLEAYGGLVRVERLALTPSDLKGLPSFLASTKKTDPRYPWYVRHEQARLETTDEAGLQCWELDAFSPVHLRQRVEDFIYGSLDLDAWKRAEVVEQAEQASLTSILSTWPGISGQASKYSPRRRS